MRGFRVGVLLSIVMSVSVGIVPQASAACDGRPREQVLVRAAVSSSNSAAQFGQGSLGRIEFNNAQLDEGCDSHVSDSGWSGAASLKTVRVESGSSGTAVCKQVEVGVVTVWDSRGARTDQSRLYKDDYVFTEKQNTCGDGGIGQIDLVQVDNHLQAGTDDIFRISGERQGNGDERWYFAVNYVEGTGYVNFGYYTTSTWNSGVPNGEAERFFNGSGMQDHHTNLQIKGAAGGWSDWGWNVCQSHDNIGLTKKWGYTREAADAFKILRDDTPHC